MSETPKGIEQFKAKYAALKPNTKKAINVTLAGIVLLLLIIAIYYSSGLNKKVTRREPTTTVASKNFAKDTDRNTSIKLGVDKKVGGLESLVEEVLERMDSLENFVHKTAPSAIPNAILAVPPAPQPVFPPEEPQRPSRNERKTADFNYAAENAAPQQIERTVGGIGHIAIPVAKPVEKPEEKKGKLNYIPSNSIFKAMLITGVYAPTMAAGKQNPSPVMLRIQDLSFFPNEIRRNLSGCFVGGEAFGNLSEERVQIRLLNLSCISPDAKKIIDIPVQGYVQGEDGIVALPGTVISKEGRMAAVSFWQSALQGLGGGMSEAATTQTITPVGGVTSLSLNEGELFKYSLGKGMEGSFKELARYYINILNEIAPVIEIMGGREVEVIITKGVELKMEDWEWEGIKD